MLGKRMLIDTSKCTACRACMVACKQWHSLPAVDTEFTDSYTNPPDLTGADLTNVQFTEAEVVGKLRLVLEEKKRILNRGLGLELVESQEAADDVGGLESFKAWMAERALAFAPDARHFGLPAPDHRPLQLHPTVSQDLLSRVGHGDITVKRGIRRFDGDIVTFDDDSREPLDAIIWCTGYKVKFPFFDPRFFAVRDNVVPLWNRMIKPGIDNLFFVGLYQPLGSIMQPAEFQARIIGELLLGHVALPDPATMEREIGRDELARARRYRQSRRQTMQVDVGPFMHQLERILRDGRRRARRQAG